MGISNHYTETWTALALFEIQSSRGDMEKDYAADSSIGTDGVFKAHSRMLSDRESRIYEKLDADTIKRIYCSASHGITIKHRLRNSSGEDWNVVSVDNPHNLGKFLQVDIARVI